MNRRGVLLAALAVCVTGIVASGCSGIPVPADKKEYVGEWRGVGTTLTITPDGGVDWKRVSGSGSRSVTAPIQSFSGADFTVGVWIFTTTFKVQRPPYQQGGRWKMVIDGVEVTRLRP